MEKFCRTRQFWSLRLEPLTSEQGIPMGACLAWDSARKDFHAVTSVRRNACKVPVIVVRFWLQLENVDRFYFNCSLLNFVKIRSAVHQLLHVNKQTDRHGEANSVFETFSCERAQKSSTVAETTKIRCTAAEWDISTRIRTCPSSEASSVL
jgi:hypothetical protein